MGEDVPTYDFIVGADNEKEARKFGFEEADRSYSEYQLEAKDVIVSQVETFEDLLNKLLIVG